MSLLGRPRRKLTWTDLTARLGEVGPTDLVTSPEPGWVAWHDGPGVSTVLGRLGETVGWEWAVAPTDAVPGSVPTESGIVFVHRSLSPPALAVALVRFYGAHGRYFSSTDERGREQFARICDADDPQRSGYAIVDAIADAVLAAHDAEPSLDELSATMRRLGYEALWADAFKHLS
jgi:hypothetical protein